MPFVDRCDRLGAGVGDLDGDLDLERGSAALCLIGDLGGLGGGTPRPAGGDGGREGALDIEREGNLLLS